MIKHTISNMWDYFWESGPIFLNIITVISHKSNKVFRFSLKKWLFLWWVFLVCLTPAKDRIYYTKGEKFKPISSRSGTQRNLLYAFSSSFERQKHKMVLGSISGNPEAGPAGFLCKCIPCNKNAKWRYEEFAFSVFFFLLQICLLTLSRSANPYSIYVSPHVRVQCVGTVHTLVRASTSNSDTEF